MLYVSSVCRSVFICSWCAIIRDLFVSFFFFQAEDGIRYLVRSRGLGDVYKRQNPYLATVGLRVEPSEPGEGNSFGIEVELGSMPPALSLIHI